MKKNPFVNHWVDPLNLIFSYLPLKDTLTYRKMNKNFDRSVLTNALYSINNHTKRDDVVAIACSKFAKEKGISEEI